MKKYKYIIAKNYKTRLRVVSRIKSEEAGNYPKVYEARKDAVADLIQDEAFQFFDLMGTKHIIKLEEVREKFDRVLNIEDGFENWIESLGVNKLNLQLNEFVLALSNGDIEIRVNKDVCDYIWFIESGISEILVLRDSVSASSNKAKNEVDFLISKMSAPEGFFEPSNHSQHQAGHDDVPVADYPSFVIAKPASNPEMGVSEVMEHFNGDNSLANLNPQVPAGIDESGSCVVWCGMEYCDVNGCNGRSREEALLSQANSNASFSLDFRVSSREGNTIKGVDLLGVSLVPSPVVRQRSTEAEVKRRSFLRENAIFSGIALVTSLFLALFCLPTMGVAMTAILFYLFLFALLHSNYQITGRGKPGFAFYDMWVGYYWDKKKKLLYFCPLPCFYFCYDFSNQG